MIGRPLDVRVQALLAPGEDLGGQCVQADVFYGDNQVPASAVRTVSQTSAPDASASVRIQSSVPVDEPIVTLYVRVGCTAPFSRRYVLLADPITEPLRAAPAVASSAAVDGRNLPSVSPVPAVAAPAMSSSSAIAADQSPSQKPAGGVVGNAGDSQAVKAVPRERSPVAADKVPRRKSNSVSVVRRAVTPPPAPRLELEPVDISLAIERDPVLRLSMSMLSEPATSEDERAAAARLWKAINASPEEILRDNQKLQVLEAEAKGLREQEERNKAAIADMQSQLERSRYLSWLVYALGAALLAALLGLLFFWRKRGTPSVDDSAARAWWAAAHAEKGMDGGLPMPDGKAGARAVDLDLDLDLGLGGKSVPPDSLRPLGDSGLGRGLDVDSTPAPLARHDKGDFTASQPGVSRSVATEELFDVQQQADFFVSLGEFEQAIQVLRDHLAESTEPSPMAYLDLFNLYHRLGRRDEYNHLRDDFNRIFNGGVPPFDQYRDRSRGLEQYERALSRIQVLWPQPKVLDVIEQSIFREQGDTGAEVFDLEAYRELLLLHAIAKEVIKREGSQDRPGEDFAHTAIKPLKAADSKELAAATVASAAAAHTQPMDHIPHASPRLGLDVDLDELSEISAFEASLPEVEVPVQPTAKPSTAPGVSVGDSMGNLIDFEMLDFMPPDEEDKDSGKPQ